MAVPASIIRRRILSLVGKTRRAGNGIENYAMGNSPTSRKVICFLRTIERIVQLSQINSDAAAKKTKRPSSPYSAKAFMAPPFEQRPCHRIQDKFSLIE
jgi:hypothetical protein